MNHVRVRQIRRDIWRCIGKHDISEELEHLIRQLEMLPPFDNRTLAECLSADSRQEHIRGVFPTIAERLGDAGI